LIDPGHFGEIADKVIEDGEIARIIENGQPVGLHRASNIQHTDPRIIDAANKILTPGLIDRKII